MSGRRILPGLFICLSIVILASQNLSNAQKSQQPEYKKDFEQEQQTNPEENPNRFQERAAQRWAEQQRNFPDFERLRDLKPEQRIREMQKMAQEQETRAMKQALGVNEEQWKIIEPKLNKVKALREQATVSIGLPFSSSFVSSTGPTQGRSFGGGFQYQFGGGGNIMSSGPSFKNQTSRRQTQGEKICQELLALIENSNAPPEAIRQKTLELQKARAKTKKQLAQAQKELCEVLTFRQQARLVLMGLLD
jgi:hypothetical protein